jgi:hypothetical protein
MKLRLDDRSHVKSLIRPCLTVSGRSAANDCSNVGFRRPDAVIHT